MFYVYILYSTSANRYYIGYCSNMEDRLDKHNQGATSSTRPHRPWILAYYEEFDTKTEAIKRELAIKRKKSRKYIELLIQGGGG